MELSLSKLPWQAQIGAFVLVCGGAVFGFWKLYVVDVQADIQTRQTRLTALQKDISKGEATARRLPEFQAQVDQLEARLDSLTAILPEQKDVADILRRIQGLASESSLKLQRFTPQPPVQQQLYAEVPIRLMAEGSYHNLGRFFDRISKFERIINVSNIWIRSNKDGDPDVTILAEMAATTFVLQEGIAKKGAKVPKQPSLKGGKS